MKYDRYKLIIKDEQELESFLRERSLPESDLAVLIPGSSTLSLFEPGDYFLDREKVKVSYILVRPMEYIDVPQLSSIYAYRNLAKDNLVEVIEIQTPHSNKEVNQGLERAKKAFKSLYVGNKESLTNLKSIISELIGSKSYTLSYRVMGATSIAFSNVVGSEMKRRAKKNIILAQFNVLSETALPKEEIEYRYKIFVNEIKSLNPGRDLMLLVHFPYLSRISGKVEAVPGSFDDRLKSIGVFLPRLITKRSENAMKKISVNWFNELETVFQLRRPVVIPSEVFISKSVNELVFLANIETLKKIVNLEERLIVIGYDGPQRNEELRSLKEDLLKEKIARTEITAYGTFSDSEKECIMGIILTIDEAVKYISLEIGS